METAAMKKYILLLLLCYLAAPVTAVTYYIDSQEGADANSGTSVNKPFRTLERLKSLRLNPGDSILLHTGSVHSGGLPAVLMNLLLSLLMTRNWEGDVSPILMLGIMQRGFCWKIVVI